MASGDNHHQWGYPNYPQHGQDTGQAAEFVHQPFFSDGSDMNTSFAMPQQWQQQENQFIQEPNFSSYQSHGTSYPAQQFSGNNAHLQSHQHPSTYSTQMPLEGHSEMTWEPEFHFNENSLATMADNGISYASSVQQGTNANGMASVSTFPPQGMPTTTQQQFGTGHPSGNLYTQNQGATYTGSTQQSPPAPVAQPVTQRQHPIEYQQQMRTIQQDPKMSANHHQHPQQMINQQQKQPPSMSQQQRPVMPQQKQQPGMPQHQQSTVNLHQHPTVNHLPQSVSLHANTPPVQAQSAGHFSQDPRIGTPQAGTSSAQPRQSPFNGRNVPPLALQQQVQQVQQSSQQSQQVQGSSTDSRSSSAISFTAPQSVHHASPGVSHAQTVQSRFVPQPAVSVQQPTNISAPTGNTGLSTAAVRSVQPIFQTSQQPTFPSSYQSLPAGTAFIHPQPPARGLMPPRVYWQDNSTRQPVGSGFARFSHASVLPVTKDGEVDSTIEEISEPIQGSEYTLGTWLSGDQNTPRVLARDMLHQWTKAVQSDDVAGQNEWEQRLKKHIGKSLS